MRTLDDIGAWDRGLGENLSSTDPNELTTTVTYDSVGRLTSVTPPDAQGCEGADRPATRIEYERTTSPASRPVSRVHTITELMPVFTLMGPPCFQGHGTRGSRSDRGEHERSGVRVSSRP